jgi:Ras-related C3 botulinum toxin substrate 1
VNPTSYNNVKTKWYPEAHHHCPEAKILLVGTKMDLKEDREVVDKLEATGLSPITEEQGNQMASEVKAIGYVECSALTQQGLKQCFDVAIKAVIFENAGAKKKKKGGCSIL